MHKGPGYIPLRFVWLRTQQVGGFPGAGVRRAREKTIRNFMALIVFLNVGNFMYGRKAQAYSVLPGQKARQ